ncbi:MAG: CofH family radical SAM protein, partial [Desulfatiglandales bacterium]
HIDEVHLVGACHPQLGLEYYMEAIGLIKREFPHVGVKGLTAVEVAHISKVDKLSIEEVLIALKEAGLDALAGGGAEILRDQIRERICPQKIPSELWLQIHKKAHTLGIVSNATMLFGHIEGLEDRVEHLLRLRELQEETGGFMAFVPLPFLPKNTALGHLGGPDGVDILKTVAISRLVLHNFPHIKAYWVMMGIKLASLALLYGADDLEGTVLGEKIGKEAGGTESLSMDQRTLLDLITETGFTPLRRDVLYRTGGKDEIG